MLHKQFVQQLDINNNTNDNDDDNVNQNINDMKQNTDNIDQKQNNFEFWGDDCDIKDVFNAYIYGAQILDCRSYDEYSQSHIHKSIHVELDNIENALIIASKKIIVYDNNNDDNNNQNRRNKYKLLYNYCVSMKTCSSFRITSAIFDYNEFRKIYKYITPSIAEDIKMSKDRKKYPNVIIPYNIYLGDQWCRLNVNCLKELGITHIVDITQKAFNKDDYNDFEILKIELDDIPSAKIDKYFDEATLFINNAIINNNNSKIFIHCQMGISRSTTITIAYLMKYKNYTLLDAYKLCQKSRPRIRPNDGFFNKLSQYETSIYGKTTKDEVDDLGLREKQECIIM